MISIFLPRRLVGIDSWRCSSSHKFVSLSPQTNGGSFLFYMILFVSPSYAGSFPVFYYCYAILFGYTIKHFWLTLLMCT